MRDIDKRTPEEEARNARDIDYVLGFIIGVHTLGIADRIDAAQSLIELLGRERLGELTPTNQELLQSIQDVYRLDRLFRRLRTASSSNELFFDNASKIIPSLFLKDS